MASVLSAIVPSIFPSWSALLGLCRGWPSSKIWNRQLVELGYSINSAKVRLKNVLGTSESKQAYLLGRQALCCGGWDRGCGSSALVDGEAEG